MPVPDLTEGVELNVADFKEMIQQVAFAASSDEARPVLQGVMMKVTENEITLAATDGFRISVRKATAGQPHQAEFLHHHPGPRPERTGAHRRRQRQKLSPWSSRRAADR